MGGYTTFNEAGLLREDIGWIQPDIVVVAAFLGNDVAENVLATAAGYVVDPGHPKGLTFGPAASKLVQDSVGWFPRNGTSSPVADSARARSMLSEARALGRRAWDIGRSRSLLLGALFGVPPDPSVTTAPGARPPSKDQRLLNLSSFEWTILRDPPRTEWLDRAWPLFGDYLGDIQSTTANAHASALLVVIPQIAQVEPEQRARTMADYRFREDEVEWDRPQREVAIQASRVGLPLVDLTPVFEKAPDREALYLPIDQHFTARGHRLTAEAIAQEIVARGWLN